MEFRLRPLGFMEFFAKQQSTLSPSWKDTRLIIVIYNS